MDYSSFSEKAQLHSTTFSLPFLYLVGYCVLFRMLDLKDAAAPLLGRGLAIRSGESGALKKGILSREDSHRMDKGRERGDWEDVWNVGLVMDLPF